MKEEDKVIIDAREIKKKRKSSFWGMVFIIWFIASIVGLMYFSKINGYYTVMIFGQYFFVFGLIPLTQSEGKEKLISVPFLLVGLCAIIIPFLMMNPDLLKVTIIWESVIPFLLICAFVIAGIVMVIFPIKHKKELERKCTLAVEATIVDYRSTRGEHGNLYAPVYSFNLNNKEYKVSTNVYSNIGLKEIGTIVDIKVNPENPEEFLYGANSMTMVVIMGALFLLVSVPVLIYILNTFTFIE